jgi:hypothetical protein
MKNYIRAVLDDLKQPKSSKDFVPDIPQAPAGGKTTFLGDPAAAVVPDDLENQDLSTDPEERVRQLDQQAQDDEMRETSE